MACISGRSAYIMEGMERPVIFDYLDYHRFLRDSYAARKQENSNFSHRFIAQQLGCNPAYYLKVFQGKREISNKMILKVAELLRLSKKETECFETLVHFNKAKSSRDKAHFFERLSTHRSSKLRLVEESRYEFYEKWYYVAILEVLDYHPFKGNYGELARMLVPAIKPREAQKAIEVLERLGFIRKAAGKGYEKTDALISAGEGWKSAYISNFLLTAMDLAKEAFIRQPVEKREIAAQTVSISGETLILIKERMKNLRKEILELAKRDQKADRVYQINLQAFPLAMPLKEAKLA
ncbi:MAG: hypothetical protein JWP91_1807 [Fibrobacteres bacterium]|nr:hypothetical protein [Fibrobacterota bacterium]